MDPISLAAAPPRPPRAELAGIIFLPRSIDKARATLPGGDPGPYVLRGFTQQMLDTFGITQEAFVAAVASAASDDDVAAYILGHSAPEQIAAWNAWVSARKPRNGDRVAALEIYPWLNERPDLILGLDVLAEDDERTFPSRA
jgi:hypothetical protein